MTCFWEEMERVTLNPLLNFNVTVPLQLLGTAILNVSKLLVVTL
jgi:hypothetical protein